MSSGRGCSLSFSFMKVELLVFVEDLGRRRMLGVTEVVWLGYGSYFL